MIKKNAILTLLFLNLAINALYAFDTNPITASPIFAFREVEGSSGLFIGVSYKIKKGWHLYWKNPGDTGLPTEVNFYNKDKKLHFPVFFPKHKEFNQQGNLKGYGYEDQVIIFSYVEPSSINESLDYITIETKYLACSDKACIPKTYKWNIDISQGQDQANNNPILQKFIKYIFKLPFDEQKKLASLISISPFRLNSLAPYFMALTLDGKEINLDNFKNKIIVLEWTSYKCPYVRTHYSKKYLKQLDSLIDENIVWLLIDSSKQVNDQEFLNFIEKYDLKNKLSIADRSGIFGKLYNISNTPQVVIIGKDRLIKYWGGVDNNPYADKQKIVFHLFNALRLAKKNLPYPYQKPYGCSVKY